jgi:hypothetical protein
VCFYFSFPIAPSQVHTANPHRWWAEKAVYVYTMEFFYSAIKKNEIMLFAGKQMELEIIIR